MTDIPEEFKEVRNFGNERIEVIFRKAKREVIFRKALQEGEHGDPYPPLESGVSVEDGICIEHDGAVKLRDGATIYTDIYRPDGATRLPAIVAWSPFGKRPGQTEEMRVPGVPRGTISRMATFEGPDPAYWCNYGYAVINPDVRGAGNSDGNIVYYGTQEGRDCYDLIEWVATRDWSNGKVAMSGNSWLAKIQWFAAAEEPPHLAAIAPWEGGSDMYRDAVCPGGIPEIQHSHRITGNLCGPGFSENIVAMARKYPLMNGYWEDKIAGFEKIDIPAYIVASWTNLIHTRGTFEGFKRISSKDKWLRVHNTQEWNDYYKPENLEDLRRFFDRYLKGIRNGWEYTPRVRLSVLDPGGVDQLNRAENEFPLARTQYQEFFLDAATGTLSPDPITEESQARYKADDEGHVTFTIRFDEDTEITGYMKLRIWVEADGADDMDLFIFVRKLDDEGNFLPTLVTNRPHPGAHGFMRVSHRELDGSRSTPYQPFHTHRRKQLLKPKEIVPVEIEILPMGMLWHADQQLCVIVAGNNLSGSTASKYDVSNRGDHIIHTGGKFDSHLLIPIIPC